MPQSLPHFLPLSEPFSDLSGPPVTRRALVTQSAGAAPGVCDSLGLGRGGCCSGTRCPLRPIGLSWLETSQWFTETPTGPHLSPLAGGSVTSHNTGVLILFLPMCGKITMRSETGNWPIWGCCPENGSWNHTPPIQPRDAAKARAPFGSPTQAGLATHDLEILVSKSSWFRWQSDKVIGSYSWQRPERFSGASS